MSKTPERLIHALRQYRHNTDNSGSLTEPEKGFVIAFDYEETCAAFAELEAENKRLRETLEAIAARNPMQETVGGAEAIAKKALQEQEE